MLVVRWNLFIVLAAMVWAIEDPTAAEAHLRQWMRPANWSRLKPFKLSVRLPESHFGGILAWTQFRLSNGALKGMTNKIKLASHRSFGLRSTTNNIAAIYHCCAKLPLPNWK